MCSPYNKSNSNVHNINNKISIIVCKLLNYAVLKSKSGLAMWPFAREISCITGLYSHFHITGILQFVRYEVLMVVTITINTFWVATPCSPAECYKRFEGICCFHQLQGNPRVERVIRASGKGQGRRAKRANEWKES